MSTAITLRNVSKTYEQARGAGRLTVVNDVTLRIEPGELFFLLGPSGCGKTTLLRMIAGFIPPTAGQVLFDDRDVTHVPPNRRNTAMVFQSYALWPHMSVEANVAFGLGVRKVPRAERRTRAIEALRTVQMEPMASRRPNQLSGGQQQRVALARALVIRPAVLLLDEPLSNLDAKLRLELRSEIRRVCKTGGAGGASLTAVYVTHDQKEAISIADRIAIMRDGRVVQVGPPAEVYQSPTSTFVAEFLGEANFLDGVVEEAAQIEQEDRFYLVRHGALGRILARHPKGAGRTLTAGTEVRCLVRPESVRVTSAGGGVDRQGGGIQAGRRSNTLSGVVTGRDYHGDSAVVEIRIGGINRLVKATMTPRSFAELGQASDVAASFEPGDTVLIPSDS